MRQLILAASVAVSGAVALPAFGEESATSRTVLSCPLTGGGHATLKAIAHGFRGEDGDDLFVEAGGKTERAFLDMPDADFLRQHRTSEMYSQHTDFCRQLRPAIS